MEPELQKELEATQTSGRMSEDALKYGETDLDHLECIGIWYSILSYMSKKEEFPNSF